MKQPLRHKQAGFSLLELSIVLIVLSLLASAIIPSLGAQRTQQAFRQTEQKLDIARDALLGYAVRNGYLPCPSFVTDTHAATYGEAGDSCIGASTEGFLPFRTLGLTEGDGWYNPMMYRVDPAFTHSLGQNISLTTAFTVNLAVYDSQGNKLTSDAERPVALLMSSGADGLLNGENGSFETVTARYESHPPTSGFDDIVIWLGRPSLFGVLIKAGVGM